MSGKFALGLFSVFILFYSGKGPAQVGENTDTPSARILQFENPKLGKALVVEGMSFSFGNMTLLLDKGSLAPVSDGGLSKGLFFSGKGRFLYESTDKTEHPVLAFNIEQQTKHKAAPTSSGTLTVESTFERLFLRVSGLPLPEPNGLPAATLEEAFADHRKVYTFDRYHLPSHLFLKAALDHPQAMIVRAEMKGEGEHWVYLLDTIDARSETLYTLFQITSTRRGNRENRWPAVISDQPHQRSRRDFKQPLYLLTDLTYDLAAQGRDIDMSLTQTLAPRDSAQKVFRFNFMSYRFDRKGERRDVKLVSVTDDQKKPLFFDHREHRLMVVLPEAVPPDQSFKIHYKIRGDYLIRPGGDKFWQLGVTSWFPQPELNGQYYTVNSTVRVEKPFVPFTPGETLFRGEEDGFNVVKSRIDKPVQFTVVNAGNYSFHEKKEEGLTVRVASYGVKKPRAMKKLANLAHGMIKYYEPWLGPFPFKEFNILEINSFGFGQAPPGTMYITQEAFAPRQGNVNKIFSKGINDRFAHEIAHQYWGHVVKMGSREEQWLTESFAEYSSSLVVLNIKGDAGYNAMVKEWKARAEESYAVAPIPLANRIRMRRSAVGPNHRVNLLYNKGAYLLYKIHMELGDKAFLTFLNSYQTNFAWKYGTTKDVAGLLTYMTKKDYGPFFEEYFWGTGMPE